MARTPPTRLNNTDKGNNYSYTRFFLAKQGLFQNMAHSSIHIEPELRLARAIIDQALHDLGNKDIQIREEAIGWFDILNSDFWEVCEMAEIDPKRVLHFYESNEKLLTQVDVKTAEKFRKIQKLMKPPSSPSTKKGKKKNRD